MGVVAAFFEGTDCGALPVPSSTPDSLLVGEDLDFWPSELNAILRLI